MSEKKWMRELGKLSDYAIENQPTKQELNKKLNSLYRNYIEKSLKEWEETTGIPRMALKHDDYFELTGCNDAMLRDLGIEYISSSDRYFLVNKKNIPEKLPEGIYKVYPAGEIWCDCGIYFI